MSATQILKPRKGAPILGKFTYNKWSNQFIDVLSLLDVSDYITEVKKELRNRDTNIISEDDRVFQKQDQSIRIVLSRLVPDTVYHLVGSKFTSKECWDNLRNYYCPNPSGDIDDLLN